MIHKISFDLRNEKHILQFNNNNSNDEALASSFPEAKNCKNLPFKMN